MELFALTDEVADIELQLMAAKGAKRLAPLVALAWQLRQRDSARAQQLCNEADAMLAQAHATDEAAHTATEDARSRARLILVRGELCWLLADLDAAKKLAQAAVAAFEQLADHCGIGDGYSLLSSVYHELGNQGERDQLLECALGEFQACGDDVRWSYTKARILTNTAFLNAHAASEQLTKLFDPHTARHPAVNACVDSALGVAVGHLADFGLSAKYFLQAYRDATESGQVRLAIVCASNGADTFASLGDMDSALEWDERALAQARVTGWPSIIAFALMQTGNVLRLLGRHADASAVLNEALGVMDKLQRSRFYALTTQYLGDLSLDMRDPAAALDYFTQAAEHISSLGERIFLLRCWNGQANALGRLDRPQEALVKAHAALSMAQEDGCMDDQIKVLRVLAQLFLRHTLPHAEGLTGPRAALQCLEQALAVAATIAGFTVPSELIDEVSNTYAECGDYREAYEYARAAAQARDNKQLEDARNRAVAMQIRMETAQIRAEGERHRQMAETHAQRASVLQEANATLETLGQIGRDITASLNADDVFRTLERHVSQLLPVTSLGVYLIDPDGMALGAVFAVEDGIPSPMIRVNIDHPSSSVARCARERQEIAIELDPASSRPNQVPGTRKTSSLLFAPMSIGERLLGVLTIQSVEQHAYGERERLVFRTLCAYGAIALDNSNAYRQLEATLKTLREAQAQLEEATTTDPLTGLRNRRFLMQHIEVEVALALRRHEDRNNGEDSAAARDIERDLVFFMVDLDHFKSVNDTYGHASGDMVLVQMRERLQEVFRASDFLIRWGGEEFLLVARATNRAEATLVAERIRMAVYSRPFDVADGAQLSMACSTGFASYPFIAAHPRSLTWLQVVELADQAMYIAKKGGRNAWIGLYASDDMQAQEGVAQRLIANTAAALQSGELRLMRNQSEL